MAVSNIYAAPLTALPDGRLRLGTEQLSRSASERLRGHLAYGDGSLPSHVGLRETQAGREVWRIEDGAATAIPFPPASLPASTEDETGHGTEHVRASAERVGVARHRYIMTPAFDEPLPEFDEYQ